MSAKMKAGSATEPETVVVFRTFLDSGDVIAIFPEQEENGYNCGSYMHVGQHGACDPIGLTSGIVPTTRPSTREEIAPLQKELENIGYRLRVKKRLNRADLWWTKGAANGIS